MLTLASGYEQRICHVHRCPICWPRPGRLFLNSADPIRWGLLHQHSLPLEAAVIGKQEGTVDCDRYIVEDRYRLKPLANRL
jgi:hypothetical protein